MTIHDTRCTYSDGDAFVFSCDICSYQVAFSKDGTMVVLNTGDESVQHRDSSEMEIYTALA